jgi:hypothetical protein
LQLYVHNQVFLNIGWQRLFNSVWYPYPTLWIKGTHFRNIMYKAEQFEVLEQANLYENYISKKPKRQDSFTHTVYCFMYIMNMLHFIHTFIHSKPNSVIFKSTGTKYQDGKHRNRMEEKTWQNKYYVQVIL